MSKRTKTETLAEYLARGGTIRIVAPSARDPQVEAMKPTPGGPVKILTFEEAELYQSEGKPRKKSKAKATSTIDLSALPEALRKKFIDRYVEGDLHGEEDED